jgi:hypothetical protein
MLSGYRATAEELPKSVTGFPLPKSAQDPGWRFLAISRIASELNDDDLKLKKLRQTLEVAHNVAFKAFQLLPGISAVKVIGMIAALALVLGMLIAYWRTSGPIVKIVGVPTAFFVLSMAAEALLVRTLRYRNSILQWIASLLLCIVGGPFLWIHLNVVDRYYINWGPKYRDRAVIPLKKTVAASVVTAKQSSVRGVK